MKLEPQILEITGRNFLKNELIKAGIEVATPERDKGVDLIAYVDKNIFQSVPIQLKAFSNKGFNLTSKYKKFPNLIMAYVWNLQNNSESCIYALTYEEAVEILNKKGSTKSDSWINKGFYAITNNPSKDLILLLEPYKMKTDKWKKKLWEEK